MNELLPFITPGCGVWFTFTGACGLLSAVRSGGTIVPAENTASKAAIVETPSAAVRDKPLSPDSGYGRLAARIGGAFWICMGIAVLWFSDFRAPWILPSVGLFWIGIGAWMLVSRQARQAPNSETIPNGADVGRRRRQRLTSAVSLCAGIAILVGSGIRVGAAPIAIPQPPDEDGGRLAEIVTRQAKLDFAQHARVGLVVGAVANGEETLLGFGARHAGDSQPPDAETAFEIGSITKTFTGILLARRIERGELDLDDRIAELLPEGWSLSESAREISLQHCTTHTSGLPRLPSNLLGASGVFRAFFGGDPYRDYSEEQFRDALSAVELEFEPGTERRYSNFAVGLLGFVLATRNGTDYETLVTSEICQPLGMRDTTITGDKPLAVKHRAAVRTGPAMLALESAEWQIPNHLAGAGALRSTGRDMMTFLKANMGLVSTELDAAISLSHQELYRDDMAMGMNWIRTFDSDLSQRIIWHNGGTGGFSAYLGFTEDRQYGVFVLSNTASGVDGFAKEILKAIVREYALQSDKPILKTGAGKLAAYAGVRWENDRPVVQLDGERFPIVSVGGVPVERIIEFAEQEYGDKARERFDDLAGLLSQMGRELQWVTIMGLETGDGQVSLRVVKMTEPNLRRDPK